MSPAFQRRKTASEKDLRHPTSRYLHKRGEMVSLKDFLGEKQVILYLYPRDNTPGCTKEACAFRDRPGIGKLDVEVIGVSSDSVESHRRLLRSTTFCSPCSATREVR